MKKIIVIIVIASILITPTVSARKKIYNTYIEIEPLPDITLYPEVSKQIPITVTYKNDYKSFFKIYSNLKLFKTLTTPECTITLQVTESNRFLETSIEPIVFTPPLDGSEIELSTTMTLFLKNGFDNGIVYWTGSETYNIEAFLESAGNLQNYNTHTLLTFHVPFNSSIIAEPVTSTVKLMTNGDYYMGNTHIYVTNTGNQPIWLEAESKTDSVIIEVSNPEVKPNKRESIWVSIKAYEEVDDVTFTVYGDGRDVVEYGQIIGNDVTIDLTYIHEGGSIPWTLVQITIILLLAFVIFYFIKHEYKI